MSHIWTPDELTSNAGPWSGDIWRVVESTSRVSTIKLVDTLEEQAALEEILERSKPIIPSNCGGLHPLLLTPFRYRSYPTGSRFRSAEQMDGAFYGSEAPNTAIAELAFYRHLFFQESPGMKLPANPVEHTNFQVSLNCVFLLDLTKEPFLAHSSIWEDRTDYRGCQLLADVARAAGIQAIKYKSVRDPAGGANIVVFDPAAFSCKEPKSLQTWHIFSRPEVVQAICEMPKSTLEFSLSEFQSDIRLSARNIL